MAQFHLVDNGYSLEVITSNLREALPVLNTKTFIE
jgi:hypothetical protein